VQIPPKRDSRAMLKKLAALLVMAFVCLATRAQTNFLAADFSDLAFFESRGVTYQDAGRVMDGLQC